MASSFSNLVNNLSEEIHKIKCKYGHDNKKCEPCGIKYKYCDYLLKSMNFKDENTNFCVATEVVKHKFDKKLKEQFFYSHKLPNHDKNKFF